MAGIERSGGDESPRERVLIAEEIKAFWANLHSPDVELAAPTRLALKLLLVTAQRRGDLTFTNVVAFRSRAEALDDSRRVAQKQSCEAQ